jgi:hypothetical protein
MLFVYVYICVFAEPSSLKTVRKLRRSYLSVCLSVFLSVCLLTCNLINSCTRLSLSLSVHTLLYLYLDTCTHTHNHTSNTFLLYLIYVCLSHRTHAGVHTHTHTCIHTCRLLIKKQSSNVYQVGNPTMRKEDVVWKILLSRFTTISQVQCYIPRPWACACTRITRMCQ